VGDTTKDTARAHALRDWEKISNPKLLQQNLVLAGLYLVAYELLCGSIVDRLRNFFSDEITISPKGTLEATPTPDYSEKVLALHMKKKVFPASCLWLREMQAITAEDLAEIRSLTDYRNELAHELPSFIVESEREIDVRRLERIRLLVDKIERWWIREVEIPTNPEYDGREIADENIKPGIVMFLDMVLATAVQALSESARLSAEAIS
jgi:hypothetical protein